MGVYIDKKLLITTVLRALHFDLPKGADNNLKHEIDFIKKSNQFLSEPTTKNKISHLLSKYKHGDNHKYRKQESK